MPHNAEFGSSPSGRAAERARRRGLTLVSLGGALVVVALVSLGAGAVAIAPGEVRSALISLVFGGAEADAMHLAVVGTIRAPRVLFGALVGATLGVSGAALQGIFRNPLADPGLIGVSSGASLGVACAMMLGGSLSGMKAGWLAGAMIPAAGFVGGLIATSIVYRLATRGGRTDVATMLLAGIAINAFCGAGLGLLIYAASDTELRDFTLWTLGSLTTASWSVLALATPVAVLAMAGLIAQQRQLNAMLLGESEAYHLGIDADAVKKRVVALSALAVGASVGFAGMVGFVGLVVPHLLRLAGGADHRLVLPGSALLGAALLVGADALARTVAAPAELPIGVITSLIGAPFFLWLLARQLKGVG
ncbi:heme ABC transporter permease [Lujinxingia litoralis]|uniref:Heme ABC transporter permease n=2 Tax=Lujinxingia litoralis TaxID=2211119 RepID=A0A328C3E5_9DELT|nr:heme ABC transporter permease [Lujinxingia litoralis]